MNNQKRKNFNKHFEVAPLYCRTTNDDVLNVITGGGWCVVHGFFYNKISGKYCT